MHCNSVLRRAFAASLACLAAMAQADAPADGFLDTQWGLFGSGKSLVPFDLGGDLVDQATASVLGVDGSLFIAGTVKDANGIRRFGVAKLKPDGILDTAGFGGGDGRVLSPSNSGTLVATSMARRNNTLYVGGYRIVDATNRDFVVCVFSTSGVPLLFQSTGTACVGASFDAGQTVSQDMAYGIAVQNDGKIVVAGTSAVASVADTYAAFARFNSSGLLDSTFGPNGNGLTLVRTSNVFVRHRIRAVRVASNGKIAAVGSTTVVGSTDLGALVIRLNSDGTPDALSNTSELSFSKDGSNGRDTVLNDLLLEDDPNSADDKFVVVGYADTAAGERSGLIARLNTNGTFDGSFRSGTGHLLFTSTDNSWEFASVARQPGYGYLMAGTFIEDGNPSDLSVCRIRHDGVTQLFFQGNATCGQIDFTLPGAYEIGASVQVQGNSVYLSGSGFKTDTDIDFVAAKITLDRIFFNGFD